VVGNNRNIRGKDEADNEMGWRRKPDQDGNQRPVEAGAYCTRCAAWRGELGSEPTPEQFVANLVAVFREVRRVLNPTGVLVLNLGDSYAGSGKGPSNSLQRPCSSLNNRQLAAGAAPTKWTSIGAGYKAKDLMQMPARVAMALQADGWYLRSAMPWLKRAAMPESVTDRPSNALEWLFLFSKAPRYFWDAEAIRQKNSAGSVERFGITDEGQTRTWNTSNNKRDGRSDGTKSNEGFREYVPNGRAFRNTDPWFLSLDAAIADARADLARLEAMRATGGVLTDDDGLPLAVDINPAAYKEAHFATYPPALVAPFVKAGTSERGCCPRCLAPYSRVVERTSLYAGKSTAPYLSEAHRNGHAAQIDGGARLPSALRNTLGWQPSCACDAGEPIPCTILDPFLGSGTTALCADRLGRDAIGIELSEAYARMAEARIAGDAPLWVDMAEVEATAGDYAPLGLFGEAVS
jgi:hypothetical protein